jgi:outer membrane protein assembly factor BamD (BamD/ComL family)
LLFLCLSASLAGCIPPPTQMDPLSVKVVELQNAENLFSQRKYSDAVNAYRKIVTASPAPTRAVAANAQYGIAFTLAYYDNPQRNYAQAIQELDEFLRMYTTDSRVPEAQNLRFILQSCIDFKKDNEHLKKSIEQLKNLDIRHEERRGGK